MVKKLLIFVSFPPVVKTSTRGAEEREIVSPRDNGHSVRKGEQLDEIIL
jgi:hypothetical protein